jgi:DNA-binding transcriptional LysR family regulator
MLNEIDLSRIDLNLLVVFDAVLTEQNVGRAAARLNLTPSAISHGLGRLRRMLNDPLFLRNPRGVVPTARAMEIAPAITEILTQVRSVIAMAEPFDPITSRRRFVIGAPDGVSAVVLMPLLKHLEKKAPGVDISLRQLLPTPGTISRERAWQAAFDELEGRAMDVAILPVEHVAPRFAARTMYEEEFAIAMRAGHPFGRNPTLRSYCDAQHLVVSHSGDAFGFVDASLAAHGLSRRIALAVLAQTELISALPKAFVAQHGERFGIATVPAPLDLDRFQIQAVATKASMMDSGLVWLVNALAA